MAPDLVVVQTHPVQYHAPVWRCVQQEFGLRVAAVYGSDFSVAGYRDREFNRSFAWDVDLLSGYEVHFLGRVADGGAARPEGTSTRGLDRILADLKPATVLVTAYRPEFYREAVRTATRGGCPLIFRGETTDEAVQRGVLKRVARDWALRRFYRQFAKLLYIGENSRAHFRRLGVDDGKLLFAPYCVDATVFSTGDSDRAALRESTRAEFGLSNEAIVVLFSGKLIAKKCPGLLIEAVTRLPESVRSKVAILFVGDGELRPALEARAAKLMPGRVVFTGFQNQTRLSRFFHAADLFILPSEVSETWGLVVNEALLHGLAAVVSDRVGCGPDLVTPGRTGEIFPAGSVDGLAGALKTALSWCRNAEVRAACRECVGRYSVRAAAAGVVEAVQAVKTGRTDT